MYSINHSVKRLNDCLMPFSTFISGHKRWWIEDHKNQCRKLYRCHVNTNAICHVPWNDAVIQISEKFRCQNSKQTERKIKTFNFKLFLHFYSSGSFSKSATWSVDVISFSVMLWFVNFVLKMKRWSAFVITKRHYVKVFCYEWRL